MMAEKVSKSSTHTEEMVRRKLYRVIASSNYDAAAVSQNCCHEPTYPHMLSLRVLAFFLNAFLSSNIFILQYYSAKDIMRIL